MNPIIILHSGLATGTVLLFATIGEIYAERSGILNLGVEGMMLLGAMAGFSTSLATQNPWLGLIMAMLTAGLLSLLHGLVTIHFQADQVVSGLSLTFLGTGLALVFGTGLTGQTPPTIPSFDIPLLVSIPWIGPIFFEDHSLLVYFGFIFAPLAWYYINRTRPGMHLRAVGEKPEAADTMGINVYRLRYMYVFVGGCLAGLGRSHDQPFGLAWLVQHPDHVGPGLDRRRAGDLCAVGSAARRPRFLSLRRPAPWDP
jgi:ABC-type uncharacterized transport system permease subunit